MRLIDADRLIEDMAASCLPTMEKGISGITGDESTIVDHINHAPTIDAVPLDRLGDFGKLFMDYTGCPRGAMGRACMPIEEEVLQMKPITDVDGGRWIPVNADALHELVKKYASLRHGCAWTAAINMNDMVKVKLTDHGKDIYYHQHDAFNMMAKPIGVKLLEPVMPEVDTDGYTSFQLWHLMQLYGPHIRMGGPLPFDLSIVIPMGGDPHDSGQ